MSPHTGMASTATRVEIASSHISVSLLNIPPSMPKLLGRTQVTIVSQCCGSQLHVMLMPTRLNVKKKRHHHLINPMLSRKLFELWVFCTKANMANNIERGKTAEILQHYYRRAFYLRVQQVYELYRKTQIITKELVK